MMQKHCPHFSGLLVGQNKDDVILTRTRCKQWSCEYCAKKNKAIWRAKMINYVIKNLEYEWAFYTLTAHSKTRGFEMSIRNLQSGWVRLSDRMRRASKKSGLDKLQYARVYELHKDGSAHWHMIANWTPNDYKPHKKPSDRGSRWLSQSASSCGMGWNTDVRKAGKRHAGYIVAYATKYMTKSAENMPKGIRRVQTSQGWNMPMKRTPKEYEWEAVQLFYLRDAEIHWASNRTVTDVDNDHVITLDDFETDKIYHDWDNNSQADGSPLTEL